MECLGFHTGRNPLFLYFPIGEVLFLSYRASKDPEMQTFRVIPEVVAKNDEVPSTN